MDADSQLDLVHFCLTPTSRLFTPSCCFPACINPIHVGHENYSWTSFLSSHLSASPFAFPMLDVSFNHFYSYFGSFQHTRCSPIPHALNDTSCTSPPLQSGQPVSSHVGLLQLFGYKSQGDWKDKGLAKIEGGGQGRKKKTLVGWQWCLKRVEKLQN